MEMIEFLPQELFIVVVATYVLGLILKKIEFVEDRFIIIFLSIFSISAVVGLNGTISVENVILGIIATGIAVLGNQSIKQLTKKEDKKEGDSIG